jgi:hypothetical protein
MDFFLELRVEQEKMVNYINTTVIFRSNKKI